MNTKNFHKETPHSFHCIPWRVLAVPFCSSGHLIYFENIDSMTDIRLHDRMLTDLVTNSNSTLLHFCHAPSDVLVARDWPFFILFHAYTQSPWVERLISYKDISGASGPSQLRSTSSANTSTSILCMDTWIDIQKLQASNLKCGNSVLNNKLNPLIIINLLLCSFRPTIVIESKSDHTGHDLSDAPFESKVMIPSS